jgi:uncharacterized membrane protein
LEPDPDNAGGGKNTNVRVTGTASQTKRVAVTSVMAALIAVMTMTAIPMPPPLSTITLAPIMIFVAAILLGPYAGLTSAAIGSAIGYTAGTSVGTIMVLPGYLYVYLLGIIFARGPMGFVVGLFRKQSEVAAMVLGVVVETFIFFAIDLYLFGFAVAVIDFGTFVDLTFVPVTYGVLVAIRRILNTEYLA